MKVHRYNVGGRLIIAGRRGHVVLIEDLAEQRRARLKARSVHEARRVFTALGDLSIKAEQFDLSFSLEDIATRVAAMLEAGRWFANRKKRTYAG